MPIRDEGRRTKDGYCEPPRLPYSSFVLRLPSFVRYHSAGEGHESRRTSESRAMSQNMTQYRPGALKTGAPAPATPEAREARLQSLYARWEQFAKEYEPAYQANDQETMTNLRGLMLLIKREILRLGGQVPSFPYGGEHNLADL